MLTLNENTQKGLKFFGCYPYTVDGVMGPKTQAAIVKMFNMLAIVASKKGYEFHKDYNLIGIRTNDKYTNEFTDWGVITAGERLYMFPMSTMPGINYYENKQYVAGLKGVAVLVEGQYPAAWKVCNSGWTGKPFLQQVDNMNIYRDDNCDGVLDRYKKAIVRGMFGINFHSWKNFLSNRVQNLSAGCQVIQADVHDEIWPYIEEMGKSFNITYTLLHFNDFQ